MIEVELPDGRVVEIDTDDPQQAAKAARNFMQKQQTTPEPQPESMPQSQEGAIGQAVSDMASSVADIFTGYQRTGQDIERTPSLFEGDFLADLPASEQAKIVGLAQITPDPNELAQIVSQQVPDTQIQYNRDEQGNVYPVLRRADGRVAMVDKPGIDLLNIGQFATDMAAFTPAGRGASLAGGIAKATGTEAARQATQASAGGEFNEGQVALAGTLEGGGRLVERGLGALSRGTRGQVSPEIDELMGASEQFNVPLMTSDVVPPRTAAGRAGQVVSETVPVVGTGGKRAAQQEAREEAVDQFIERFQGGSYDQIVQSLKNQRDRIKTAAGRTYERITPKLNAAIQERGGITFDNTRQAVERARDQLTEPGREVSEKALDLIERIQRSTQVADQSFGTLKSNISSWQEALDAIDPAMRDQLPSADKKIVQNVLRALRAGS